MKLRTIILLFTLLTLLTALGGLFFYFNSVKTAAIKEDRLVSESHLKNINNALSQMVTRYQRIALTMSRHDEIVQCLERGSASARFRANQILDLFNSSLGTSVCYLLNSDGIAVASSNRNQEDSFVGKNYGFRPYFTESMNEAPSVFMASGITSNRRGIYFGTPVYSPTGKVIGVSVIKEDIETIEDDILFMHYPTHAGHKYIIIIASHDGVIFISDRRDLLLKTMWPLDDEMIRHISESRQFGKGPWDWAGFKMAADEKKVADPSGRSYRLLVSPVTDIPEWEIIHLSDSDAVMAAIKTALFRVAGYVFVFVFLIIGGVLLVLNRLARKAELNLTQSEARYRSVTETVNEGIVLQAASGEILTWNRGAEEIFGIPAQDVIGRASQRTEWSTIHPDGSNYDGKDHPSMRTLATGKPVKNEIMGVYRPKGDLRWISVNTNPLFQEDKGSPYAVAISFSDITELKREKDQSRKYLDVAGVMLLVLNGKGDLTLVNKKACEILESSEDDLIGKNWFDHFLPDSDIETAMNIFRQLMRGQVDRVEYVENRILTGTGKEKLIAWHNTILKTSDGTITGTLSSGEDITARRRAAEALKEERDLFQRIMETSPAGITRVDEIGNVVYANRRAEEILGIRVSETKPHTYNDPAWKITDFHGSAIPDEDLPFQTVRRTGRPVSDFQHALEWPDGRQVFLSINATPLYRPSGEFDGIVASLDDITEKYKAEQNYKMLFREMLDGFALHEIICDDSGTPVDYRFLAVNPAFERLTGLKGSALIGKRVLAVLPGTEPDWIERYGRVVQTGIPAFFENYSKELDRHFQVTAFRPAKNQFACIIADVTDRRQMEARLLQAQKMESIGSLAGGIAHDFNNILFPIIGMAELLLEDLTPGSLEYENAQEILKAGERGGELVTQILAFSRQSEIRTMPVRIQQVLRDVFKLSRASIPSDIEISQDIQPDCGMIMANATQVHQIAMNLITNAYHAVEENGGRISVSLSAVSLDPGSIREGSLNPGKYALLSVADTGCGMEPDILDKIFDPYFTTKEQGKGTGLGLSIVYGIVKGYGGDIRVESETGKGTVFKVFFPLMEKSDEVKTAKASDETFSGTERILLIDDEEPIASLEKQLLERLGYRVTERTSSTEALAAFKSNPYAFDLVITDMTMPNMTGDRLAVELLAIRKDIPIIICTGFSERIDPEQAKRIGVKGFLMKPVVRREMAQMIRKVLEKD